MDESQRYTFSYIVEVDDAGDKKSRELREKQV
jgi:hypothetical protein